MTFLEEYDSIADDAKVDQVHEWIGTRGKDFFTELRESRPVLTTPGPVVVTRYDDVQEVLSREKVFTVRLYAPKMDPVVGGPYMLARDATRVNERDKGIMQAMLRREDLPRVREMVARLANHAVDDGLDGGRLDVVSGLTRRVPIELCGEYFGFPGPDLATMMRWSRTANRDFFFNLGDDPEIHGAAVKAGEEMRTYLDDLIARRRADGGGEDDILGRLVATRFPDVIEFDQERIRANVMFMLLGGVETVSGACVLALDELLRRPDKLAAARRAARDGDDHLLAAHLWEALRLNPVFAFVVRYCEQDYTLASGTARETRVPAGTWVYASLASACFDAAEIESPDEFRLDRPEHHLNLHFGYGHHLCLCYYLSLVEVPEILKALLRRGELRRAPGDAGQIDTGDGPFAEHLYVELDG